MANPFLARIQSQANSWLELSDLCREVLGDAAYEDSWWMSRIGLDSEKVGRVMAEIKTIKREGGKIRNTPAYAEYLWQHFV